MSFPSGAHVLERGRRSSIVAYQTGEMTRVYHDTKMEVLLPFSIDEKGVARVAGNRSLHSLCSKNEQCYRGTKQVPLHIQNALHTLMRDTPSQVSTYAVSLGVKESTAWCYLCKVVESFPFANVLAANVVFPPLLAALASVDDRGSLRQVMERLNNGPLKGSIEWKCVLDRFAHVRLARLCLMVDE